MGELWNEIKFSSPPINTYKSNDTTFDVSRLHTILSDAVSFLENQNILHREAALVSRLIYNMGRKFRHDIGHSYIRRTNTALLKYLNLNYVNELKTFLSVVPENIYEGDSYVYLPMRQMMEYILIRTQTLGKILFRINLCAKRAALFYFERLKRGDSAWLSLMPYSVLSRVWLLTKTFLKNICKWYNNMFPFLSKLNTIGASIIPDDYEFPKNFAIWINVKELDVQSTNLWKNSDILSQFSNTEIQKSADTYEMNVKNLEVELPANNKSTVKRKLVSNINEDVGEKISRNDFNKLTSRANEICQINKNKTKIDKSPAKSVKKEEKLSDSTNILVAKSNKHELNSVRCLKSFKMFLKIEDKLRSNDDGNALSKDIGLMQWQSLKTTLCRKILKLLKKTPDVSPKLFAKFFQELWLEKFS